MDEKKYLIKAIFPTIQGEGFGTGTRAIFIRLSGCNLWTGHEEHRERDAARNQARCPLWCDTDFRKEGAMLMSPSEILDVLEKKAKDCKFIVISGGEPFLQIKAGLLFALQRAGYFVAVETNGTQSIKRLGGGRPDWITCSPKTSADRCIIESIDELKLVVPEYNPKDFQSLVERVNITKHGGLITRPLFVQPCDKDGYLGFEGQAIKYVYRNPEWRISLQTHKILGVE